MSVTIMVLAVIAGIGLSATAMMTIVRIIAGPTLLDRMIASDVLLTTLMLVLGVDMVLRGHTDSIPLMTAIAATATFATIVVARYVRRQRPTPEASAERGEHV
ncbi:multicomponent Na+:H+ antiporter subunit F [Leucobacter exalbidus]|uniref:Multicomponent Na+:H+ antiporter subunit F n=1 Tax=Leucobacter exalbidus TaxID=662960 RepID=A0A940PST0_9MICO|nr:monovalent cation/H+ antiporter complex subunit F [Leucobacter exalbidus]MBP1325580.1 multicomponent Na+:H+ antiporter subunit F [Leucobacter exalbidus]